MKRKMKWILVAGGLGLLLFFSMLAPMAADAWTDRNTLGELSYEKIVYEPYEITYYNTFGDKLDAITNCISEGGTLSTVGIEEGQEAPDDEALIQIANGELNALYQNGILPHELVINEWENRVFMELYVLPQGEEYVPLQDICFWKLTTQIDDVWLAIYMDSSFYKIYGITFLADESDEARQEWVDKILQLDGRTMVEGWCSYWELGDVTLAQAWDDERENERTESYDLFITDADLSEEYYIFSDDKQKIRVSYWMQDFSRYGMTGGCFYQTGMRVFMDP